MTLAIILCFCLSSTPSLPQSASGASQPVAQNAPAGQSAGATTGLDNKSATPDQTPSSAKPAPSTSAPATPASAQTLPPTKKPAAAKRPRHKKAAAVNCTPAAASSGNTSGTGTGGNGSGSGTASAPTNCPPPPKIIVRQGGTSEPSIQLAGDQASTQREATNQLLSSTDANLKKLEGHALNANQQDMVNQVRQFTQQSRSAMQAGDFERARTLAWKAQLLSEELVNPGK